jgi:hypothetical protein
MPFLWCLAALRHIGRPYAPCAKALLVPQGCDRVSVNWQPLPPEEPTAALSFATLQWSSCRNPVGVPKTRLTWQAPQEPTDELLEQERNRLGPSTSSSPTGSQTAGAEMPAVLVAHSITLFLRYKTGMFTELQVCWAAMMYRGKATACRALYEPHNGIVTLLRLGQCRQYIMRDAYFAAA